MKANLQVLLATLGCLAWFSCSSPPLSAAPLGTAFVYQGKLADSGQPANGSYDFQFILYDTETGGIALGPPNATNAVAVSNGFFSVNLEFGPSAFKGDARWLEIEVATNGSGIFTNLTPRQKVMPVPYALYAPLAGNATTATSAMAVTPNSVQASGIAPGQVVKALNGLHDLVSLVAGTNILITLSGNSLEISAPGGLSSGWSRAGNVTTAGEFLGSVNDQPLEFRVDGVRAFRLEPTGDSLWDANSAPDGAPNVIAGSPANLVAAGVVGASIGGGGATNFGGVLSPNSIAADFATIAGGMRNTIGSNAAYAVIAGGFSNLISESSEGSVVVGGRKNELATNVVLSAIVGGSSNAMDHATYSSIGGGHDNTIRGIYSTHTIPAFWIQPLGATIGGGFNNSVSALEFFGGSSLPLAPTIGGGYGNSVIGADGGTIPGGISNFVSGFSAFAAGYRARARHDGSFVWADASTDDAFGSTGNDQFLIRAAGGVGIGTSSPQVALDVAGTVRATHLAGDASSLVNLNPAQLVSGTITSGLQFAPASGPPFSVANSNKVTSLNSDWLDGLNSTDFWKIGGNSGTTAGTHFLGTADHEPFDLRVNNERVLRLVPTGPSLSPNLIGGSPANSIGSNVAGSVIAGGGHLGYSYGNTVDSDYSFVGGGWNNHISGGAEHTVLGGGAHNYVKGGAAFSFLGGGENSVIQTNATHSVIGGGEVNFIFINAHHATIAGGQDNRIENEARHAAIGGGHANRVGTSSQQAAIGGGEQNLIGDASSSAVIAGGSQNTVGNSAGTSAIGGGSRNSIQDGASSSVIGGGLVNRVETDADASVIAGGRGNVIQANAQYASIPGGSNNVAAASFTLAAGRRARANHLGSFVWADAQDADFASTADNQFGVRASGGVRVETSGAGATIDGEQVLAGNVPDSRLSTNVALRSGGNAFSGNQTVMAGRVGIGTPSPSQLLDIRGTTGAFAEIDGGSGQLSGLTISENDAARWILFFRGWQSDNLIIRDEVGNRDTMTFESGTGRVGIGTGTPAHALHVAGDAQFDKNDGRLVLNTPSRNDPGRQGIQFSNNSLGLFLGDDTQEQTFGFYSAFALRRTNNARIQVHGRATNSWDTYVELTHDGATGQVATDLAPLELRPAGQRSLRLEPNTNGAPNVIGGSPSNTVNSGVVAATIAGGGATNYPSLVGGPYWGSHGGGGGSGFAPYVNRVAADFGAIGGGGENTVEGGSMGGKVGGGLFNQIGSTSVVATVSGGAFNLIASNTLAAVIGGGLNNTIDTRSWGATISGGSNNTLRAGATASTIGGGSLNEMEDNAQWSLIGGGAANSIRSNAVSATIAGGAINFIGSGVYGAAIGGGANNVALNQTRYGTIPGGLDNAVGDYAFAAGRRAKARHAGAFVWADSQNTDFASSSSNQFLVRASGGVGINKDNPASALDINGTVTASAFAGDGSALSSLPNGHALDGADGSPVNALYADHGGKIGIGTTSPQSALHVHEGSGNSSIRLTCGASWPLTVNQSSTSVCIISNVNKPVLTLAGANVGIGTAIPAMSLHVASSSGPASVLIGQRHDSGGYAALLLGLGAVSNSHAYLQGVKAAGSSYGDLALNASGGNVGIGTTTPAQKLHVAGRIRMGTWTGDGTTAVYRNSSGDLGMQSSDRRLKQNITPITNALAAVRGLTGVTFNWRGEPAGAGKTVGLIAQDVQAALPELTFECQGEDGETYLGVHYEKVAAVLANAVNELHHDFEAKLDRKNAEIEQLTQRLARLEQLVGQLTK